MTKKQRIAFLIILGTISIVLSVISLIVLPDYVITQFGTGGNVTKLPKIIPILLSLGLGVGGAIYGIVTCKGETETNGKPLIVSGLGVIISTLTLLINMIG